MTGDDRTYEQLVAELEALVEQLATGDVGIEKATELYEEAVRLHGLASERLTSIEARIAALSPPEDPGA